MAKKKLSAKQIKFFGTKRQRAALKAKRSNSAKRHAPRTKKRNPEMKKGGGGRVITGYGSTVMNPHNKKLIVINPGRKKKLKKKSGAHKHRRNPIPEIISLSLGNPARKKGHKTMAKKKTKKYKKSSASRSNAGRSTKKKASYKRKRNPGLGNIGKPMDWIQGGVGVIGGAVGARVLPELAGASNTGGMGYALNFGATLLPGFAAHMLTKSPVIVAGVIGGGVAATLVRIATDNTPFGQYVSLSGRSKGYGDYVVWNFSQPQRVTGMNASRIDTAWNQTPGVPQDPMMAGSIDKFRG